MTQLTLHTHHFVVSWAPDLSAVKRVGGESRRNFGEKDREICWGKKVEITVIRLHSYQCFVCHPVNLNYMQVHSEDSTPTPESHFAQMGSSSCLALPI